MTTWKSGWYVVSGDVTLSSVTVADEHPEEEASESTIPEPADVKLILKDGCSLTVEGTIDVTGEDSLTIFAQKGETGKLTVRKGIGGGSRIACGNITIHGGRIAATGDANRAGIGGGYRGTAGNVTIYGGNVTASSNISAGIGGVRGTKGSNGGDGGTVNIYGGNITAASTYGAAIGGGSGGKDTEDSIDPDGNGGSGGTVNIYGGNVTATTLVGAAIGAEAAEEKAATAETAAQ